VRDIDEIELITEESRNNVELLEQLEKIAYEREKIKLDLIKEFTPPSLRAKSEVTEYERYQFARLELLAEPFIKVKYRNHFLDKFIHAYLEYGISLHRKGRLETKDVIQSFYATSLGLEEMMQQVKEEQQSEEKGTFREKIRRYLLE